MKIMAIDLGKARTGVAVCDESELLSSPVAVISEHNQERLLEKIQQVVLQHRPNMLVVGLPRNMDGSEGESAQHCRAFAEKLRAYTQLPVEMRDERGTTITAYGYLNNTDTRGKKRKAVVDAVAATIILQDFLDYRRNQKQKE